MVLERLRIVNVRNISQQEINFSNNINVLYGDNGSGKTTVLEAIYSLSVGKSFRTRRLNTMIQQGAQASAIEGWTQNTTLKLHKKKAENTSFFVANNPINSISELARLLPVQLLSLQGYQLLNTTPDERRKFFDWVMFHVEPKFLKLWQDYHRVLKQRNALLRDRYNGTDETIQYWTEKLATLGQELHHLRELVLNDWIYYAENYCSQMPGVDELEIMYQPGWPADKQPYLNQLAQNTQHDRMLGYTRYGPHRADLDIRIRGEPASQMLSTGQQKTFVATLQLAQTQWVAQQTQKFPILLIDDLPSELDSSSTNKFTEALSSISSQVFITSVEKNCFSALLSGNRTKKLFHVERGTINEV